MNIVSEKRPLKVKNTEALLHCSIMQATVTHALLDERKLQMFTCPAVAHVRGETDLAFKIE